MRARIRYIIYAVQVSWQQVMSPALSAALRGFQSDFFLEWKNPKNRIGNLRVF